MKNVAIVGYGRMGGQVKGILNEMGIPTSNIIDPRFGSNMAWRDDSLAETDVAICFTSPDAGYETSKRILKEGVTAIVGTTKFYENPDGSLNRDMLAELDAIARENKTKMLYAENFDPSINLISKELDENAETYAQLGFRPVILEVHHTGKTKDVSGTAKGLLGKPILEAYPDKDGLWFDIERAIWPEKHYDEEYDSSLLSAPFDPDVKGKSAGMIREQMLIAYEENKIPLIAIRYGDIPGTHRVIFIGESSILCKDHEVIDRKIFARGAVKSADLLEDKAPGLYYLKDLL